MRWLSQIAGCALAGTTILGCAASNKDGSSKMTADALTPTELAAYAASHHCPSTPASDDLRVAAVISPDRSELKLYNFSNAPLASVDVWVNGAWMQHVRGIGASGSVILKTTDLYNAFGKNFASQSEPVSKVQLGIGDKFYNAMGPVTQ
jgi:hypothetical protein